jgi:hypothetical protein
LICVDVVWGVSQWRGGLAWLWGGLVCPRRVSRQDLFIDGLVICTSYHWIEHLGIVFALELVYLERGDLAKDFTAMTNKRDIYMEIRVRTSHWFPRRRKTQDTCT